MYEAYDKLPCNIAILKDSTLKIEYFNEEFKKTFEIDYGFFGKSIYNIDFFDTINESLNKCFVHKICKNLSRINIKDKYFDFIIKYNNDSLEVFAYEISKYINNEMKAKKDKEKLLAISTEIKTKYDIVQNVRNIEKEGLVHLKDVMNNISEGIVVLGKCGIFDFCNKSALQITGYTIEEIKNYREILQDIDIVNGTDYGVNLKEAYEHYLKNFKNIESLVIKIHDKVQNEYKYIDVSFNHVINNKNEIVYTVISLKDITEMKTNEIMIKNQNKELEKITKMKDDFFNMISHELRTPLTIIHSSLQLANHIYSKEITANIAKILLRINQNCSRLLKLINNTLDISKAEAGFLKLNYSVFDIVFVTESIISSVNFYAKSRGIKLIFDTNQEEIFVKLDKDKYEKIILNLLSNAIKFTPEGKEIMVIVYVDNKQISIRVKDNGIGIPEDKINKIFDRFEQVNNSLSRNSEGTGLGLALVKNFVKMMEGKIDVQSKVGEGTEFNVKFSNKILHDKNVEDSFSMDENLDDRVVIEFSDVLQ
ncbi:sensor histidine kinase [Clostridium sp. ZS2-4]|uniref:sensor histidine kinase n=1 Tax=Clostridium sp. ZS2-4 TaxID=2987703 RepID=UPI00227C7E8E|nr:PAS domain-containing sensor histidine kinase [Clostridium sp. ZS2-4]MCY6356687.1 PAS domain-containing sensor histidine kinase [Clostridium sp. ZS2-4]